MNVQVLRWGTRSVLTFAEISLIAYVVYLIFGGNEISEGLVNSLSVVLGGLILNFGKSSSFWFSRESVEEEEERKE